jgi:hypothetical protein
MSRKSPRATQCDGQAGDWPRRLRKNRSRYGAHSFQRSEQKPGRVEVALLQLTQKRRACTGGASFSHDLSAPARLRLRHGDRRIGIGPQVFPGERLWMIRMRVQRRQERRTVRHDPDSRVPMPVDTPLMALGQPEKALQLQVVARQVGIVASGKQAGREGYHCPGHGGMQGIAACPEPSGEGLE